jgi:hypothetical protein
VAGASVARFGLTLVDVCDFVHSLLRDRLERQALAALSAGAGIDVGAALDQWEDELVAVPKRLDPEQLQLRMALGVA